MIATKLDPRRDPHLILEALYEVPKVHQPELVGVIAPLLDHCDPYVREEAIRILITRWKLEKYRDRAAEMLVSDEAPDVRGAAAYALGSVASNATRAEHTRLLLDTLRNRDEEPNVRGAAYDALLILHRNPAFPTKKREFDPHLDVNWQWVDSLST
jgi:HEAT repeat protein